MRSRLHVFIEPDYPDYPGMVITIEEGEGSRSRQVPPAADDGCAVKDAVAYDESRLERNAWVGWCWGMG
jgi:hypothetical protein